MKRLNSSGNIANNQSPILQRRVRKVVRSEYPWLFDGTLREKIEAIEKTFKK